MKMNEQAVVTYCPDCEEELSLGPHPRMGQKITCPECWAELKIVSLKPIQLDFEVEVEEEWDLEQDWVDDPF